VRIEHFPENLCTLPNLKFLSLGDCELESLPRSILDLNLLFDFEAYSGYNRLCLRGAKLQEMDINIFRKKREEIEAYYDEIEQYGRVLLNESRVIFIGHGRTGKSSIINTLITGEYVKGSSATRGIAIKPWFIDVEDGRKVTVNFWDFGGQDIMHLMHEFFMGERCPYVIILDGRQDEQPEYWLDMVKQLEEKLIDKDNELAEMRKELITGREISDRLLNIQNTVDDIKSKTDVITGFVKRLTQKNSLKQH